MCFVYLSTLDTQMTTRNRLVDDLRPLVVRSARNPSNPANPANPAWLHVVANPASLHIVVNSLAL